MATQLSNMLQNGNQVSLSDPSKQGLRTIDATGGNPRLPKSIQKSMKDINRVFTEGPDSPEKVAEVKKKFNTPGAQIDGTTPKGVPEADEIEGAGKALGGLSTFLKDPNTRRLLSDLGMAFVGGDENTAAGVLSKAANRSIESEGLSTITSKLLAGEDIGNIDTRAFSPETVQAAQQSALAQERQNLAEQTESRVERQGDEGLDLEQQRVDLQDRANDLRERGLDIDEKQLGLQGLQTVEDIKMGEERLDILESRTEAQNRLDEARALALSDPTGTDPDILKRREVAIETLSERLESEQNRIQDMEDQLAILEDEAPKEGYWGFRKTTDAGQRSIDLAKENLELQKQYVQDLSTQINELSNLQAGATGGSGIGSPKFRGSRENPVTVRGPKDIEGLSPGTFVTDPSGRKAIVREGGLELVEEQKQTEE